MGVGVGVRVGGGTGVKVGAGVGVSVGVGVGVRVGTGVGVRVGVDVGVKVGAGVGVSVGVAVGGGVAGGSRVSSVQPINTTDVTMSTAAESNQVPPTGQDISWNLQYPSGPEIPASLSRKAC